MTRQDTFDIVVEHLRSQGGLSVDANGRCAYRGTTGFKCAAGCLIPDDDYDTIMEGQYISSQTLVGQVIESLGHDLRLVSSLQLIHDKGFALWEPGLAEVSRLFGLNLKTRTVK